MASDSERSAEVWPLLSLPRLTSPPHTVSPALQDVWQVSGGEINSGLQSIGNIISIAT